MPPRKTCRLCDDDTLPWKDSKFSGTLCKSCNSVHVVESPFVRSLRDFWNDVGWDQEPVTIVTVVLMIAGAIALPLILCNTEGRVSYTYVWASQGEECRSATSAPGRATEYSDCHNSSNNFCLMGHEAWHHDRTFRCGFTTPQQALEFGRQLGYKSEAEQ